MSELQRALYAQVWAWGMARADDLTLPQWVIVYRVLEALADPVHG